MIEWGWLIVAWAAGVISAVLVLLAVSMLARWAFGCVRLRERQPGDEE